MEHAVYPNTDALVKSISQWIETNSTKEFQEFKRRAIRYVLADDFEHELGLVSPVEDFHFSPDMERQHFLIMSFLRLKSAAATLGDMEYYFRRYPFRGSPITKHQHARNMCEFYFSCFYVIKNRIKITLNALKAIEPDCGFDVGKLIKIFDKHFDPELRSRNRIIHHENFDDLNLDRLLLTYILSQGEAAKAKGWDREHSASYRKFCR